MWVWAGVQWVGVQGQVVTGCRIVHTSVLAMHHSMTYSKSAPVRERERVDCVDI